MEIVKILATVITAILIASCVATPTATPTRAPITTATSAPTSTATNVPTSTSRPTDTPTPRPTETRTPTPTATATTRPTATLTATPTPDLSAATITLNDLPAGFRQLSPAEAQQMGMTESALAGSFGTGRARNFATFLYSDPRNYELIALLLVYPLTAQDIAGSDLEIAKHEPFCKALGSGPGLTIKSCQPLPGIDEFKDRALGASIGATTTINLRADVLMVRRGAVAEVVYVFYPDGLQPQIGVNEIVRILDARVATAVGGK